MWPCTMNMIAIREHMNYGKNCCFFLSYIFIVQKKKKMSKRMEIMNEEKNNIEVLATAIHTMYMARSMGKKSITRKIVETIKIEAFSKPELCVRYVCLVWIDLNVSHQGGKKTVFFSAVYDVYAVYICGGDRLIRVNNWPNRNAHVKVCLLLFFIFLIFPFSHLVLWDFLMCNAHTYVLLHFYVHSFIWW